MKKLVLVFALFVCACAIEAQVKFIQEPARIRVEIDGRPFTALYANSDTTKPYLHPLRSAAGVVVSRFYPMDNAEGERNDHIHQRGLWFSHGAVNGCDFWRNDATQQGARTGRILLDRVIEMRRGEQSGALSVSFAWVDSKNKRILNEVMRIVFYSHPALRVLDFDIGLTAIDKAIFGDTKEGGVALRLAPWLEEPLNDSPDYPKRTGRMVNASGQAAEKEVWGKRSEWVDYCGNFEGEKVGIAIFDHPENPRHPAYWHSRGYGLFAANIFGLHDFLRDKTKDGSLTLERGESLRLRYRVVIHDGDTAAARIAAMYRDYASRLAAKQ